jgi:hypothetical protein
MAHPARTSEPSASHKPTSRDLSMLDCPRWNPRLPKSRDLSTVDGFFPRRTPVARVEFPFPTGSSRLWKLRLLRPVQSTFGLRNPERTRVLKRTEQSNDQSNRHLGSLSDDGRQGNQRPIRANGRSRPASQKSPVVMFGYAYSARLLLLAG